MSTRLSNDSPDRLLVMALPMESQGVFEGAGIPVLYTGVGKVNATYALTRRLCEYARAGVPMPQVINFGTVGSRRHVTGAILECHVFVQRDMDVTGLGVPLGVTPLEEEIPPRLEFPALFPHLSPGVCGTGDSFLMTEIALECDVVDMEAYALAKVCWLERVVFTSVKYVTDGADHASSQDWRSNLKLAADQFLILYRQLFGQR
jgi:adenosylhomocysteine nucleosidase